MIIEKLVMLQNSSNLNSNDYKISKSILTLNKQIKRYTLRKFLEYAKVSKTTMVRYMKRFEISEFTKFKDVLYTEFNNRKCLLGVTNNCSVNDFISMTKGYKKIIVLGGEERFSLCVYQSDFISRGITLEIPIITIADMHYISENIEDKTLFILINLSNTVAEYLDRSAFCYLEAKYLFLPQDCDIIHVGKKSNYINDDIVLEMEINGRTTSQKISELCSLFESLLKSL